LLLPLMIAKSAPQLQLSYLSILEVGGAFAHRFRSSLIWTAYAPESRRHRLPSQPLKPGKTWTKLRLGAPVWCIVRMQSRRIQCSRRGCQKWPKYRNF
jgi:hypothetical protein